MSCAMSSKEFVIDEGADTSCSDLPSVLLAVLAKPHYDLLSLPSPTRIVYHSLPNKSSKDIVNLDWRQVGIMGTLQLFPIFPILKDITKIQTVLHRVVTIANIAFAPVRTVPPIDRTKYKFTLVGSISFVNSLNHHTASPYV